jgi:hypothetical protein
LSKILIKFLFLISIVNFSFSNSPAQDIFDEQWNEKYRGKIIRNIIIRTLNVVESLDEEKNYKEQNWLLNAANSVHYKTRDWVVKENLLFEEGEKIKLQRTI